MSLSNAQKQLKTSLNKSRLRLLFYERPDYLSFIFFIFQVNGMDIVRIPLSLVPYEDRSASYQQQAAADVSEPTDEEEAVAVKAVSDAAVGAEAGEDSVSQVSEASASAGEETAGSTQTTQDPTAPPSDSPKKD